VDSSMSLIVLLHTEFDGTLARPALEAVASARGLASALDVPFALGLVGTNLQCGAVQVGSSGASRVVGVAGGAFAQSRYATDLPAAEAMVRAAGAEIVLVPGTSRFMRIAGGLAQRLGGCADTHVIKAQRAGDRVAITRWFYRQRIEGTLSRTARPWVIALEPGTGEPWAGAEADVQVEAVNVMLSAVRSEVTGVRAPAAGEQTVRPDAELLLVAGAGWTKKQPDGQVHATEAQTAILSFLRGTRASLGGSKSLVDQSGEGQPVLPFMTHLNQVGQTGSSPRHRKGLATCCHGEEPHVIGWRFVSERRAVNLNSNCGWTQGKADVVYVADAFAVMKRVNEILERPD
jgi:electron transfer flavoprotein alpha subunit